MSPSIYVDFHKGGDSRWTPGLCAVPLVCSGTIQDLNQLSLRLEEGMRLTPYVDSCELQDLEFDGVARFDRDRELWFIEYDPATLRYRPCRDWSVRPFLCWSCRKPAVYTGRGRGDLCSNCGALLEAPWAPPG